MEDAANCLGAGRLKTTAAITLPLIMPALLGAWIITFLEAMAIIGSSVIVALPAKVNLVTLQLWEFFGYPLRVEVAAAYSMPLLLITAALFALQQCILRNKGYVSLTGKGGERRLIDLGRLRWVLLAYSALILSLSIALPYLVLLQAAFAKAWAQGLRWNNLTLANFQFLLFQHSTAKSAILNTIVYRIHHRIATQWRSDRVFLMGDGVNCAARGQKTPDGYYNVERMLQAIARRGEVAT